MPPTELGRNSKYVFALPARYNYSYPTGWEEVDQIMKNNPLKTFNPWSRFICDGPEKIRISICFGDMLFTLYKNQIEKDFKSMT